MITMPSDELLGPLNDVEQKYAPKALYIEGDRSVIDAGPRVSVIGSRAASAVGLRNADTISRWLVERSVVVVSGLAEGIDTAAHQAAIAAGGRTIAVLGTPLEVFFPTKNRALQLRIMREHLAISQFALGTPVEKANFPMRNRTMALISAATIIVEAGSRSGTEHQGWEALRLGRPLFILDTVANGPGAAWVAKMVDYGAMVLSIGDLWMIAAELPSAVGVADLASAMD